MSEDITGATASPMSYTMEGLRELVGRVQQMTKQVTRTSPAMQTTSESLMAALEERSYQIRQTG